MLAPELTFSPFPLLTTQRAIVLTCAHSFRCVCVCSVLSPLSYISSCCFLRAHWFRHTRRCAIDPQPHPAPVWGKHTSPAVDLTHVPNRVTFDPFISFHSLLFRHINTRLSLFGYSPNVVFFFACHSPLLSAFVSRLSSVSLCQCNSEWSWGNVFACLY